ncbi:MAG: GntR family transcriptional regulator [Lautropia sp.]
MSQAVAARRRRPAPDHGLARGGVSLYIQVAGLLRRKLEAGVWRIGDQLPIIDVLMAEYGVSRITMRQAIARLEDEGLLKRGQGRGTFVTGDASLHRWVVLPTEWHALVEHIEGLASTSITLESTPGMPRIEEKDGKPAPAYRHMQRVNLANGAPYSLTSVYLDDALYRKNPASWDTRPVLPLLARQLRRTMGRASQMLEVNTADIATATHLRIAVGTPTVHVRRVVANNAQRVVYVADVQYPAQALRIETLLHP